MSLVLSCHCHQRRWDGQEWRFFCGDSAIASGGCAASDETVKARRSASPAKERLFRDVDRFSDRRQDRVTDATFVLR